MREATIAGGRFVETSRYLIDTTGIEWPGHHRRSTKPIPDLPSWVPDNTRPVSDMDIFPVTRHAEHFLMLFPSRETTTETSLYADGAIIDRISFKITITKEIGGVEVAMAIARAFSARGRGIFDPYMDKFREGSATHPDRSNGAVLLSTLFHKDYFSETGMARRTSYLAWRLSTCEEIPPELRRVPRYLESGVNSWRALSQASRRDFDLDIRRRMDVRLRYDMDLILTERGYLGLTHNGEARVGGIVGLTGGTVHTCLCLLEEKSEGLGKRYYEYVDMVQLTKPLINLRRLEQLAPGAVVERLEIR